jgi:hypothetical protein
MILTDTHLEAIKAAAATVEFGSVTIQIAADADRLELNVQNRIRFPKEPERTSGKPPLPANRK